ncbi:MAG: DUF2784 family protein [Cyanobacteriota bacterium]|nr:DUF2784 family protein [Cyanobacteriota bacterium]
MNWKNILIALTKFLHILILFFVMFGWLIPSQVWRIIHLIFIPAMIVQWQFNQGTCILTNFENKLRGETAQKQQQQGQFIKGLLGKYFQPLPSDQIIKNLIYGIITTSWLFSWIGLLIFSS